MKYCRFCGKQLRDNAKFCSGCGKQCAEESGGNIHTVENPQTPPQFEAYQDSLAPYIETDQQSESSKSPVETNEPTVKGGVMKYDVDIVMCIDATASMGPFLDLVKSQALNLYGDIKRKMEVELETPKYIDELRVRVIAFRDYLADGEQAMLTSGFYSLPAQAEEFETLIRDIQPKGGGDYPEDGLEALAYAIKSKWNTNTGNKYRQVIVIWTDDGTHDLGYGRKAPNYPTKMPESFAELTEWWGFSQSPGVMDDDAKRLLIYAPAKEWWTTITETWNNTLLFASQAGKGLDHLTYDEILSAIAMSI